MLVLRTQEELVLRLRFGSAREAKTREHGARRLGMSDATVRRVERGALRKLRRSALGSGWQRLAILERGLVRAHATIGSSGVRWLNCS